MRSQLDKTTTVLIGEVEEFKEKYINWNNEVIDSWDDWVKASSEEHQTNQQNHKDEFRKYLEDCKTRIEGLENIYQEKLRLEKPAEYWKKAASRYGKQGALWMAALIFSILLGVVYFYDFFTSWLVGEKIGVELNTVQGVIIFGSLLTIYAYLIKTLSKLTFSSFHLMRDAEEREQLTYLYLSLVEGNKIDEGARDIVLQALFSRSETGLLASESGPTMPGIAELIKHSSKLK